MPKTYRIQIARVEGSSVLEDFVQAFFDRVQLVGLEDNAISDMPHAMVKGDRLTMGMSSSETGSLEDKSL
jgi:hypothetical protein